MSVVTALSDGWVVTKRNTIKIKRVPDVLVFSTLSPIMFVLIFGLVFGGAVQVPGVDYREFLMAGIFAQTAVFGATFTGASLAEDLQKGIIDRFRSLPMSDAAVLIGRTTSDVLINITSLVVMSITGFLIGWRIRSSVLEAIGGFLLLLLFAFALSWVMAPIGLAVRSPEVFNNASFIVIFPLTFIANTFVDPGSLPAGIRQMAEWNPISAVVQAVRELFGNTNPTVEVANVWSLQNPLLYSLIWIVGILVVFVPLSVRQYRRAAGR